MYTIIDNFLPISIQNMIEYHYQYKTRWNYSSFTSGDYSSECDEKDTCIKDGPQLLNVSHHEDGNLIDPDTFGLTRLVLYFLEHASGCTVDDIFRIKTNMNLKDESFKGKYHPPHADSADPEHLTLLYTVKDSDGPTRLFNKSINDPMPLNDLVEIVQHHPKKGRAILFPSNVMHSGTCPIEHENRISINYIFKATNLKIHFQPLNNLTVTHCEI